MALAAAEVDSKAVYFMTALKVFKSVERDVPVVYHINFELAVVAVPAAASDPNAVAVLGWLQTAVYLTELKPVVVSKISSVVKSEAEGTTEVDQVANVKRAVVDTATFAMAHSQALAPF